MKPSPERTLGVALLLASALAAAGCSSAPGATPTATSASRSAHVGGVEVTVPALWADPAQGVGGIEPAVVWAGTIGPPGFGMELQNIAAQGAGPAWTAATASAAAVGTMYSGLDPANVDIDFQITGPIDGPSAGGILTVGVLAALRNAPLKPGITMTGTISPDGSIGPVGGVDIKLTSAAEAGYTTVLLPPANMQVPSSTTGEPVSAVQLGRDLGITVVAVATLAEAYEAFTGRKFAPTTSSSYSLPASVTAASRATAETMIARASDALASADEAKVDGRPDRARLERQIAAARSAFDAGDNTIAYGLAADAYLGLIRMTAELTTQASVDADGLPAARAALRTAIDDELLVVQAAALASADPSGLGLEQQLSLPAALAWASYAEARLKGLQANWSTILDEAALGIAASVLAEQRAGVEAFLPDALAIVRAMPAKSALPTTTTVDFLSEYTNFLVRAGDANEEYIKQVVLGGGPLADTAAQEGPASLTALVMELSTIAKRIPTDEQSLAQELEQSSAAMAYYVASASHIAAAPGSLQASIDSGRFTVDAVAGHLAARALDAGYPVWSAQWASATAAGAGSQGPAGEEGMLALRQIWCDSIVVLMINAASPPA